MRSGTIAFLLGILTIQGVSALPDATYVQFLPLLLLASLLTRRGRLAALFLTGVLWCLFRAHLALAEVLPAHATRVDVIAEGTIVGIPEVRTTHTRFLFRLSPDQPLRLQVPGVASAERKAPRVSGHLRLNWYGAPRLQSGERWRLGLRLRSPRGFANPGGFDYERWLFVNGIRATGYVRGPVSPHRTDAGSAWHIDRWRQGVSERIAERLPQHPAAGIVTALAVGARQGITTEQWSVLRHTGTAHLMAISGLHVALVAGLVFFLGQYLWSRSARVCLYLPAPKAGAAAALVAGAGYAAMAGFSLPTQRALILLGVLMWCRICARNTSFSVPLCLALVAVVVADPFSVLGPSLWLSFGAVSVLAFGMMHRIQVGRPGTIRRAWWTWGRAQLVAAVGLAPLLLFYFGQQPLSAPVANAVAIPWTGIFVVPASIGGALLIGIWPAGGGLLLDTAAQAVSLLWPLLEWIDQTAPALRPAGAVPPWTLLVAILGALLLIMPPQVPARWLGGILMLPALMFGPARPPPDGLRFTVLDVGHGLSVVVQTRDHTLVFDTGPIYAGGFNAGTGIVAPYLRSRGIKRVDTIIVSHADSDHAGGLAGLIAEIPATRILGQGSTPCVAGQTWHWDGYRFSLIHPAPDSGLTGNNNSCVLAVRGPGGSLLITGDIEANAERRLVRLYGNALRTDYVIVPHHGSRTSSTAEFIDRVRPSFAVISNADRGRWHPHPQVVGRYLQAGASVMETAKSGAITGELSHGQPPGAPRGHRYARRRYWQGAD